MLLLAADKGQKEVKLEGVGSCLTPAQDRRRRRRAEPQAEIVLG